MVTQLDIQNITLQTSELQKKCNEPFPLQFLHTWRVPFYLIQSSEISQQMHQNRDGVTEQKDSNKKR